MLTDAAAAAADDDDVDEEEEEEDDAVFSGEPRDSGKAGRAGKQF